MILIIISPHLEAFSNLECHFDTLLTKYIPSAVTQFNSAALKLHIMCLVFDTIYIYILNIVYIIIIIIVGTSYYKLL